EGEVGEIQPALRRRDGRVPHVRVHVDDSRHDGFAAALDDVRAARNLYRSRFPDRRDAVLLHHHGAVLDHLVTLHGDDTRVGEGDDAVRNIALELEADIDAAGVWRRYGG